MRRAELEGSSDGHLHQDGQDVGDLHQTVWRFLPHQLFIGTGVAHCREIEWTRMFKELMDDSVVLHQVQSVFFSTRPPTMPSILV